MSDTQNQTEAQTPATPTFNLRQRFQVQAAVGVLLAAWQKRVSYPQTGTHSRHLTVSLFRLGIRMAVENGVQPETLIGSFHRALQDELFAMYQDQKLTEAANAFMQEQAATAKAAEGAAEDAVAAVAPAAPAVQPAATPVAPGTAPDPFVDAAEKAALGLDTQGAPSNYADAAGAEEKF